MKKKFTPPRKFVKKNDGSKTPVKSKEIDWDSKELNYEEDSQDSIILGSSDTDSDDIQQENMMLNSENIRLMQVISELREDIRLLKQGNKKYQAQLIEEAKNYIPRDKE